MNVQSMLSRICTPKINSENSNFRTKIILSASDRASFETGIQALLFKKNLFIQVEDKTKILISKISYCKQLEAKPVQSYLCVCDIIMNQTAEFD